MNANKLYVAIKVSVGTKEIDDELADINVHGWIAVNPRHPNMDTKQTESRKLREDVDRKEGHSFGTEGFLLERQSQHCKEIWHHRMLCEPKTKEGIVNYDRRFKVKMQDQLPVGSRVNKRRENKKVTMKIMLMVSFVVISLTGLVMSIWHFIKKRNKSMAMFTNEDVREALNKNMNGESLDVDNLVASLNEVANGKSKPIYKVKGMNQWDDDKYLKKDGQKYDKKARIFDQEKIDTESAAFLLNELLNTLNSKDGAFATSERIKKINNINSTWQNVRLN